MGDNKIVLCETYKYNKKPTETNHRKECNEIMEKWVLCINDHSNNYNYNNHYYVIVIWYLLECEPIVFLVSVWSQDLDYSFFDI